MGHFNHPLRRLKGDQIEVFKILNGYENIDGTIFFLAQERTRGHEVTLVKDQCRLDIVLVLTARGQSMDGTNYITDCVTIYIYI